MRWTHGPYVLEVIDEPTFTFGSADNVRGYAVELRLEPDGEPTVVRGVTCTEDGVVRGSVVVGARGGGVGIDPRTVACVADRCVVAVGDRVAALRLPELALLWHANADEVVCFGVLAAPDGRHVIAFGELSVACFGLDGVRTWTFGARDVLRGDPVLDGGTLEVEDVGGTRYRIDLATGRGRRVPGRMGG
ncbi:MAG: hypothetical protein JNM10_02160 [Planctomycetia bacterium]|nr:hypothetical protein [Planctomycetia bacterium]